MTAMPPQEVAGQQAGGSPQDIQTRLEEQHYLQYSLAQYNHIQTKRLMAELQAKAAGVQQAEMEDQPPQDQEERAIWRAQTVHGGLEPGRIQRRLEADPDEGTIQQIGRVVEQRRLYEEGYQRGQQYAARHLHAGAALPQALADVMNMAPDDGRMMLEEAKLRAFKDLRETGQPGDIQKGAFIQRSAAATAQQQQKIARVGGAGGRLKPEEERDLIFQAMQEGYTETVGKASGSRKVALQALRGIGSMIPFVAAAPALPGGILGAAATGGALGAAQDLSGEDQLAVEHAKEEGTGDPGKMTAQLRALRGVEGAVSWGLMSLGGKVAGGTTVGGRLAQAAGMHTGSEVGSAAAEMVTRPAHETVTGKDPGAASAIGKALHALSDKSLTAEQRRDALLEAGTHFAVGLATFGAVHVATGLGQLAPKTMALPENQKAVESLLKDARKELREQDVEPEVIATVLPEKRTQRVTVEIPEVSAGKPGGETLFQEKQAKDRLTKTGEERLALAGGFEEVLKQTEGQAEMPKPPWVTPPGPPEKRTQAEREAMQEALEPGTRFKFHDSVTLGGGGELEVTRNEGKGVIQVKDAAGKVVDVTPDMLDLVLPESLKEPAPAPSRSEALPASPEHLEAPPSTTTPPEGALRGAPRLQTPSEETVPAFTRAGTRPPGAPPEEPPPPAPAKVTPPKPKPAPTMDVPAHEAESPWRVKTPDGKRVPVEVENPEGPTIRGTVKLPDGTVVSTWGKTMLELGDKLEKQLGDRGIVEATGSVGKAVKEAQKAKAKKELAEKRPAKVEPVEEKPPEPKVETTPVTVRPKLGSLTEKAKAIGETPTRTEDIFGPQSGMALNPVEALFRIVDRMDRGRRALVREANLPELQEKFAGTVRATWEDWLAKKVGGPSRRIGMEFADVAKQNVADKKARLNKIAERLYGPDGPFRGVRKGDELDHDLFVAGNDPQSQEGKDAAQRLRDGGHAERLSTVQRELEYFRRFWAGHGREAQEMRQRIRDLKESIKQGEFTLSDPNYLGDMPAPLAKAKRAKLEKKVAAWGIELTGQRQALAHRIKTWGKTGGYMHRVWEELQGDQGFRRVDQQFMQKVAGSRAIGFRGLKKRTGADGFIESAIVSVSHYMHGAINKIYTDRTLKQWADRMQGEWRRIGGKYTGKEGETVDPLDHVRVGEQYRQGPDLVEVRDLERNEAGEVAAVQVQVLGAGRGSEKHPPEWLLEPEARGLLRQFGLKQMAERARRDFNGFFGVFRGSKIGNDAFLDAYKEYEKLLRRGASTDILDMIDAGEAALRRAQGYLFNTISRYIPGSLISAPANWLQNAGIIMEKIGPDGLLRGSVAAAKAFLRKDSMERWLLKDSGMMERGQTKRDWMGETGRLTPREGLGRAIDVGDRIMGGLYDAVEAYSRASAYLGHYLTLRPNGIAHQPGAPSHKAARARARETVEQAAGVYDSLFAPEVLRKPGWRLLTGMKGYMLRQTGEYMGNRWIAAKQTGDVRARIRMVAGASALSGAAYVASRLAGAAAMELFGLDDSGEGQSLSNRLGLRVKDLGFIGSALEEAQKLTGVNMDWITLPYAQLNLFDVGPGPELWAKLAGLFGAQDDREARYNAEMVGKTLFSRFPYSVRQFLQATANEDGSLKTYDAGSVFEALVPYQKATGDVRDRAIKEVDLFLRMVAGTPIRDLAVQAAVKAKSAQEKETRAQHADTLDLILNYRKAVEQGRDTPEMEEAIERAVEAQGSAPDMGQIERMERIRGMGREGRLLFSGTKEARAQAIQDYAMLKSHDQELLEMAIGELFKEPSGLSQKTAEKLELLVR